MQEYFNGKLKVFDDVLSDKNLDAWEHYYEHELTFRRGATESTDSLASAYFCSTMTYKQNIEVFDYENTIVPYAKKVNSKVTAKCKRSYINCFDKHDKLNGHTDCATLTGEDFFVATVLFLSPDWNASEGGLLFSKDEESVLVENRYNRLVCFSGDLWHCPQPFDSDCARLTHYCTFSNAYDNQRNFGTRNIW